METLTFSYKYPLRQRTFISLLGCTVLLFGAFLARHLRRKQSENPKLAKSVLRKKFDGASGARDIVEEASDESFPASDPPAWTDVQLPKNLPKNSSDMKDRL